MRIGATKITRCNLNQKHCLCTTNCFNSFTPEHCRTSAAALYTISRHTLRSISIKPTVITLHSTKQQSVSSYSCCHILQGTPQQAKLLQMQQGVKHSVHSSIACPAYVGEATPSAGEYHCHDFDWEEHRLEVLASRQDLAASSAPAQTALPAGITASQATCESSSRDLSIQTQHEQLTSGNSIAASNGDGMPTLSGESLTDSWVEAPGCQQQHDQNTVTAAKKSQGSTQQVGQVSHQETGGDAGTGAVRRRELAWPEAGLRPWQYEISCWESFHAKDNATAKFYKERRYLLLEFPCLLVQDPPQHFMEIGCGCGSSLLPVLKANAACRVTGTDLSPTAVHMFQSAACKAGIAQDRIVAFAADSSQPEAQASFPAGAHDADALLLIFTLAALAPVQMPAMLKAAFQALKPGGLLLIRDHGLYDLTHLRLRPEQQLSERLYKRVDGTMCYFFTTEDLRQKAEAAGFVTRECMYACVKLLNRKTQTQMKRVFVHGVFARPK